MQLFSIKNDKDKIFEILSISRFLGIEVSVSNKEIIGAGDNGKINSFSITEEGYLRVFLKNDYNTRRYDFGNNDTETFISNLIVQLLANENYKDLKTLLDNYGISLEGLKELISVYEGYVKTTLLLTKRVSLLLQRSTIDIPDNWWSNNTHKPILDKELLSKFDIDKPIVDNSGSITDEHSKDLKDDILKDISTIKSAEACSDEIDDYVSKAADLFEEGKKEVKRQIGNFLDTVSKVSTPKVETVYMSKVYDYIAELIYDYSECHADLGFSIASRGIIDDVRKGVNINKLNLQFILQWASSYEIPDKDTTKEHAENLHILKIIADRLTNTDCSRIVSSIINVIAEKNKSTVDYIEKYNELYEKNHMVNTECAPNPCEDFMKNLGKNYSVSFRGDIQGPDVIVNEYDQTTHLSETLQVPFGEPLKEVEEPKWLYYSEPVDTGNHMHDVFAYYSDGLQNQINNVLNIIDKTLFVLPIYKAYLVLTDEKYYNNIATKTVVKNINDLFNKSSQRLFYSYIGSFTTPNTTYFGEIILQSNDAPIEYRRKNDYDIADILSSKNFLLKGKSLFTDISNYNTDGAKKVWRNDDTSNYFDTNAIRIAEETLIRQKLESIKENEVEFFKQINDTEYKIHGLINSSFNSFSFERAIFKSIATSINSKIDSDRDVSIGGIIIDIKKSNKKGVLDEKGLSPLTYIKSSNVRLNKPKFHITEPLEVVVKLTFSAYDVYLILYLKNTGSFIDSDVLSKKTFDYNNLFVTTGLNHETSYFIKSEIITK